MWRKLVSVIVCRNYVGTSILIGLLFGISHSHTWHIHRMNGAVKNCFMFRNYSVNNDFQWKTHNRPFALTYRRPNLDLSVFVLCALLMRAAIAFYWHKTKNNNKKKNKSRIHHHATILTIVLIAIFRLSFFVFVYFLGSFYYWRET